MISSASNREVKCLRKLLTKSRYRRETGMYVAEGARIVRDAPRELLEKIYVAETFDYKSVGFEATDALVEIVSDAVFAKISDTVNSQGILAVARMKQYDSVDFYRSNGMYLVACGVRDPGNLGTMIRTAEAAGANGVVVVGDSVDLYSPKVVRATMGSLYRLPCRTVSDLHDEFLVMRKMSVKTYAAVLSAEDEYSSIDYRGGTAFLIGNEGEGLSDEAVNEADCRITIPMRGATESLNAAMAAGILMFEASRQRRTLL